LGKGGASVRLTQAAILALASHTEARVETIFQELADALRQNKLPMELRLEVVEAIRRHSSLVGTSVPPSLQLTNSSANQQFGKEYLMGGDRDRGRRIFAENQVVQCIRCHQVAGNGGVVGPKLDGIGRRVNREYLLESIVSPNARLAPGFENAVLVLEDGRAVTGIVKAENPSSIDLEVTEEDGSASVRAVPKRSITRRSVGPSAMPEGFAGLLTPFELRDLVEYLASLQ
jgi:quinoprotein glucose dehydrogenase